MSKVDGQVIIITGASSGIGEATALMLAKKGACIMLAARREMKLKKIVSEIILNGGVADYCVTDVTSRADLESLTKFTLEKYGKIDVIINNAGLMAIAPLQLCKTNEWEHMIDTNIKGVLYGIAAVLPIFQKQGFGHFINIASVAGIKVFSPGGVVYSATKHAVRAISEGLRQEVGDKIRTTTISPGAIESELKYGSSDEASRNFVIDFYKQSISADAIARAVYFALTQPREVDVNEIVLRPTFQDF